MTIAPVDLPAAATLYAAHLALTHAADYPYRQALHTHLEAHDGQIEHCRMVRDINATFDRLEREAGVSQTSWHGEKKP